MSKLTFECFKRLHKLHPLTDKAYISGYEYAKKHELFKSMDVNELIEALQSYMEVGRKNKDICAFGFAQAIREMIGERLGVAA
jgi:hypothetical protein